MKNINQLGPVVYNTLRTINQTQLAARRFIFARPIERSKRAFEASFKAASNHVAPKLILRVAGMPRVGNHAVINWLTEALGRSDVLFFNNCELENHLTQFAQSEFDLKVWKGRNVFSGTFLSASMRAELAEVAHQRPVHIVSYERKDPSLVFASDTPITQFYGQKPAIKDIVIYRSPLNWLASYYKISLQRRPLTWRTEIHVAFNLYVDHVDFASNVMGIYYDEWLSSTDYRKAVLKDLGLQNAPDSIGETSSYGGGSSFAHTDQNPDPAALTSRWRSMMSDQNFISEVLVKLTDNQWDWIDARFGIKKHDVLKRS